MERILFSTQKMNVSESSKQLKAGVFLIVQETIAASNFSAVLESFYDEAIGELFGKEKKIEIITERKSIPLDSPEILKSPNEIGNKIKKIIESWESLPDIVLIDLSSQNSGAIRAHCAASISEVVKYFADQAIDKRKSCQFIFLVHNIPSKSDDCYSFILIEKYAKHIRFISDGGEVYPKLTRNKEFTKEKHKVRLLKIKKNLPFLLKTKMKQRNGHFRSHEGSKTCTEYSYNGSLCADELQEIFEMYFAQVNKEVKSKGKDLIIVYDSNQSLNENAWLDKPVVGAAFSNNHLKVSFDELLDNVNLINLLKREERIVFVILPMIDNGYRRQAIMSKLKEKGIKRENLRFLAVIQTTKHPKNKRIFTVENSEIKVVEEGTEDDGYEFLMEVEQKSCPSEECIKCNVLNIDFEDKRKDERLELDSYSFWEMLDGCGCVAEDESQYHRSKLDYIPNFSEITDKFKNRITNSIHKLLSKTTLPADPLLIYPGAVDNDSSLKPLVEFLEIAMNFHSIEIPRVVVNSVVKDGLANPEKFAKEYSNEEWYERISSTKPQTKSVNAIIFDTINISNKTRKAIRKILNHFEGEITIHCYLFLINFSPATSSNTPILSLYEIDLDGASNL